MPLDWRIQGREWVIPGRDCGVVLEEPGGPVRFDMLIGTSAVCPGFEI